MTSFAQEFREKHGTKNEQIILFINNLFTSTQVSPIIIKVENKYNEVLEMELFPNGNKNNLIPYRFIFSDGTKSLYETFEDEDDIRNKFRMNSLY